MLETALTIGVVLIVLFGTLQLGILGFTQTSDDGAAFVAAHVYAQNPTRGSTYATAQAAAVFTKIPAAGITVTTSNGIVTATAASTADGIHVPGAAATVSMQSSAGERVPVAPGASPGPFSVAATLSNYRNASGTANVNYAIKIAQTRNSGGEYFGNFGEWLCRAVVYANLAFPSSRPHSGGGPNTFWDPAWHSSPLAQIYGWDSGLTCV
jgi:hypothetical protein